MDAARVTATAGAVNRCLLALAAVMLLPAISYSQQPNLESSSSPDPPLLAGQFALARQYAEDQQWREVVRIAENHVSPASPELNYYYGLALAHLGRLDDAHRVLLAGAHQLPADKRFALELAGVEFRRKQRKATVFWLRRALELDPNDEYASNFLGTAYFLENNLEAALKYWNRAGKPKIANIHNEPEPRTRAALLDSAFAFSPGSLLTLPDLLTTEARLRNLGVFSRQSLTLAALPDGGFDATFRFRERNGMGRTRKEKALNFFRGIVAQTVYPEYFNIGGSGVSFRSRVRWDEQKRRFFASFSGPLRGNTARHFNIGVDARNENWDIRHSSRGPAPILAGLNLRRQAAVAEISFIPSGRWNWTTGVEWSHRDYRSIVEGDVFTPALLLGGHQLKNTAQLNHEMLRIPEHRFVVTGSASSELGRIWSQPSHVFGKLQADTRLHWYPQAQGDDYEVQGSFHAGKIFSEVPFDELFLLGLERDNDLRLRAHVGSRRGRKGSAPLGRSYFLSNWEADKTVWGNAVASVRLSPFVDTARIFDFSPGLATDRWLWDTGLQTKLRALGVTVVLTYGKDLRSGSNAFYVSLAR
ncbi:MAG: hypothetical protein AB7O65_03235 [Candidatus Korobacteraceae bacterium]